MSNEIKKRKSVVDAVTNAYIRRIKKWMFCPDCHGGKLRIDEKSKVWVCDKCGYRLRADEFEDDYVFWFCDECGEYLNKQAGFDRHATRHTCVCCGYENNTTLEKVKGICSDCGMVIEDPDATLCPACKEIREQKAKEWLAKAGKVVGVVTAVAGAAAYVISQIGSEDSSEDETDSASINRGWLKSASEDELRARKKAISDSTDWRSGSILDGDFDAEIEAFDTIDEEINQRAWDQYNSEDHSGESYGVHREHGWYLPNDD